MTNPGRHLSCPAEGRDRDVLNLKENQNFYFFFQFSLHGFYTTEASGENSKDNYRHLFEVRLQKNFSQEKNEKFIS